MAIQAIDHFTVLTDDVAATAAFYGETLGLEPGPRPDLGFPGAWLYAQGKPVLHVVGGRHRDELRPGVIDHVAFTAKDLPDTIATLTAYNIEHICRQQVGTGFWQVFFHDPNGARVELDFPADEVHGRA